MVTANTVINKLLARGTITKAPRQGYIVVDRPYIRQTKAAILLRFATRVGDTDYYNIDWQEVRNVETGRQTTQEQQPTNVLRTLTRASYHGAERHIEEALARIQPDADGVKRSFGVEYEIYQLTAEQEDKLATLLDTMPSHVTERDGSLGRNGIEIVFDPVDAATYIKIVKTLAAFVIENNVRMDEGDYYMAGMHTTYGVSNATPRKEDYK